VTGDTAMRMLATAAKIDVKSAPARKPAPVDDIAERS
jgi:hypothetical protein